MNFFERIKEWFGRMFNVSIIRTKFNVNIAVSDLMRDSIESFNAIYQNAADWCDGEIVRSMGLGKTISSELARMITIESEIKVNGENARAEFISESLETIRNNLKQYTEYWQALGGIVLKPFVANDKICYSLVMANKFVPIEFSVEGKLMSAVFFEQKKIGREIYTRLEYHKHEKNGYRISNSAYVSTVPDTIGIEVPLTKINDWAEIDPEIFISNLTEPLFVYIRTPYTNNIDPVSKLGVSCFANAVNFIEDADRQYSRYKWEFEGGELAVHASEDMFKVRINQVTNEKLLVLPKGKERLYKAFNVSPSEQQTEIFAPQLRDISYASGLNKILQEIEISCGLSYGTLSDTTMLEGRTATEINMLKQRSYANVADNQKALEHGLNELAEVIDVYCDLYNLVPQGEWSLECHWDDSIIVDVQSKLNELTQLKTIGVVSAEEIRQWYFNEDEETAKKKAAEIREQTQFIVP